MPLPTGWPIRDQRPDDHLTDEDRDRALDYRPDAGGWMTDRTYQRWQEGA